ncbi:MAG TPA: polysaccharide pyruvyl transferase family protein [Luteitalea sp.]|nr:polysaccharide pyruvyl transferase family protein [Luteitalea sp.]
MISRRSLIQQTVAAAVLGALPSAQRRRPRILVRSSWQVVNIGDIAHTPGLLTLLERHLPDAEVRLWASADISPDVIAMEHRRFPGLVIVKGTIGDDGKASTPELADAIAWCDMLLHGSGASLVAARDVRAFLDTTKKPYGVYGITHGSFLSGDDEGLLSRAAFVFFRDSVSLDVGRRQGVKAPVMEFGPDAAFGCDLRDDTKADAFLRANGLEAGRFACAIPRLRYTPYWLIRNTAMKDEQKRRAARNEEMADRDHAPLRAAITRVVRETGLKVLLCPEDMSQMAVGKTWVLDKLPADVAARVVWRPTFWLTDEALSTYKRSAGLFGLEMHSPIMCVGNGVPAIVCRFEEQTSKGMMWRDIGLGDWLFDLDDPATHARIPEAVMRMLTNREQSLAAVRAAQAVVEKRQRETMSVVGATLNVR